MARVIFETEARSTKPQYEDDPDWDECFRKHCDWRLLKAVHTAIRLADTDIWGYKQAKMMAKATAK